MKYYALTLLAMIILVSCGNQYADGNPVGGDTTSVFSSTTLSSGTNPLSSGATLSSQGTSSNTSAGSSAGTSSATNPSSTTLGSSGASSGASSAGTSSAAASSGSGVTDPQWSLSPYHDRFIWVPGGSFVRDNGTVVSVHGFYSMTVEVTRAFYSSQMGSDPSLNTLTASTSPVERVSWYQAALFCNKISNQLGFDTAYVYTSRTGLDVLLGLSIRTNVRAVRLPTEAEWEYAARAGSTWDYFWSESIALDDLDSIGLYTNPYIGSTPNSINEHRPNAFGLYEVHGNVWEWTNDWYAPLGSENQLTNPLGPSNGTIRSIRGGGFDSPLTAKAFESRLGTAPEDTEPNIGFRVIVAPGL